MAETCTYRLPATASCPAPATHVCRCRWDRLGVWDILDATVAPTWRSDQEVPAEFCLRHAGDVSALRQSRWQEARHA